MMTSKRNKRISVLVILLFSILFGLIQEKVKLSLNNTIRRASLVKDYDSLNIEARKIECDQLSAKELPSYFSSQAGMDFFYRFDKKSLAILKWTWAALLIGVFLLINAAILFISFENRYLLKILVIGYVVLTIAAFSFYFVGATFGEKEAGYGVGRKILGALQSLIPTMILFPAFLIHEYQRNHEQ